MKLKFFSCFALGGLFMALFGVVNVQALEFVWPMDGAYVIRSNYLIIKGGRDPLLDGMTVEINGVKSEIIDLTGSDYRALFGDMFLLELLFEPGENKVVVEGYLNSEKMNTIQMTVFYQADMTDPPPPPFVKKVFHRDEHEASCMECHNMQPDHQAFADTRQESNPCASCHQRMLYKDHVHDPAGAFECIDCHDTDSAPVKYQAVASEPDICMDCHSDKMDEMEGFAFVHGHVDAGMCLVCHDAHASDQRSQLCTEVNILCVSCHVNVIKRPHVASGTSGQSHPLQGETNPADESKPFDCASCHNPHGGASDSYFINGVKGRMQLCSSCHKK